MKGYKAFNKDLQCRGMQYEIGGTYEFGGTPICCKRGFHFCKSISDCYDFYDMTDDTRICEVEALGDVVTSDGIKYCTNKIHVIREVENSRIKSNTNETCTGYCNSGNWNTGNLNSGDRNSGNRNSGYMNSGYSNTGDYNSGHRNSGAYNSGNWNSGNRNTGNCNTGNCNSGIYNSGDYNSGAWNSGVFNTAQMPTIKMFDKDSNWTIHDWYKSPAYGVIQNCPMTYTYTNFIRESSMSEEEKKNHPEYKIMGGYTKIITVKAEDKQKWWDGLSDNEKHAVMSLPNFDADKFYQCTEIRVEKAESDIDISDDITDSYAYITIMTLRRLAIERAYKMGYNFSESNYKWKIGIEVMAALEASKHILCHDSNITSICGIPVKIDVQDPHNIQLWENIPIRA